MPRVAMLPRSLRCVLAEDASTPVGMTENPHATTTGGHPAGAGSGVDLILLRIHSWMYSFDAT